MIGSLAFLSPPVSPADIFASCSLIGFACRRKQRGKWEAWRQRSTCSFLRTSCFLSASPTDGPSSRKWPLPGSQNQPLRAPQSVCWGTSLGSGPQATSAGPTLPFLSTAPKAPAFLQRLPLCDLSAPLGLSSCPSSTYPTPNTESSLSR